MHTLAVGDAILHDDGETDAKAPARSAPRDVGMLACSSAPGLSSERDELSSAVSLPSLFWSPTGLMMRSEGTIGSPTGDIQDLIYPGRNREIIYTNRTGHAGTFRIEIPPDVQPNEPIRSYFPIQSVINQLRNDLAHYRDRCPLAKHIMSDKT